MSLTAILVLLLSALTHALWNFLAKDAQDSRAFIWCLAAATTVLLLPVSIGIGIGSPIPFRGVFLAVASGAVQAAYFYSLARAYHEGDLSLVYPLSRSLPLLLLPPLGVLFFAEHLRWLGLAGIACVVMGIYVLQMTELSFAHLTRPLRSLGQKAQLWAIATGLMTTAYSIVDKAGVLAGLNPIIYYNITIFVATLALTPSAAQRKSEIATEWRRGWGRILLSGLLMPGSYALALYVMKWNAVSYVLAVRQVSVVIGVLLGSQALGERYGGIRLAGAAVIVAGVLLIGLAR